MKCDGVLACSADSSVPNIFAIFLKLRQIDRASVCAVFVATTLLELSEVELLSVYHARFRDAYHQSRQEIKDVGAGRCVVSRYTSVLVLLNEISSPRICIRVSCASAQSTARVPNIP